MKVLAEHVAAGLAENGQDFPSPPVSPSELQELLESFVESCDEQMTARALLEQATVRKRARFESLLTALRADVRYAEDAVQGNDAKLTALGWGGRAPRTALTVPRQPVSLAAVHQGEDWILLRWLKPADGGKVAAYRIERRNKSTGQWAIVGMAMTCEARLDDQQRGIDWEYRVVATNKAGESAPSNTVAAVL